MIHWTSAFVRHESRNAGIQYGALPKNVTTIATDGRLIARGPDRLCARPHRRLFGWHQVRDPFDHFPCGTQAELVDVAFEVWRLRVDWNRGAMRPCRVQEREHRVRAKGHILHELALFRFRVIHPARRRLRIVADAVYLGAMRLV